MFVANIGPLVALPLGHASILGIPVNTAEAANPGEPVRRAFIMFLLAGAVGGILSAITRVLRVSRGATQGTQAVSWMMMFLSPLAGALAGWAGCLLVVAAHSLKIVIPETDPGQFWLILVALAVVFGFSERFFIGLAEKVEGDVLGAPNGGTRASVKGASTEAHTSTSAGELAQLHDDPKTKDRALAFLAAGSGALVVAADAEVHARSKAHPNQR